MLTQWYGTPRVGIHSQVWILSFFSFAWTIWVYRNDVIFKVCGSFGRAGIGGVLRNELGKTLMYFSKSIGASDPSTAEIMALDEAIRMSQESVMLWPTLWQKKELVDVRNSLLLKTVSPTLSFVQSFGEDSVSFVFSLFPKLLVVDEGVWSRGVSWLCDLGTIGLRIGEREARSVQGF
ncbi:hypothetical protein V6N12_000443 [Hibiscus sabdariffa]|uniref:RNase H type-1 domain-containing protein n=1 Tax=Hibiscus sabdariffa TaxID=183260 RepID=A0ABR2BIT6_9ROSI